MGDFHTYSQAYYRKGQALEMLECFEDCINSFTTSFELQPQRKTIHMAVTTALTHGIVSTKPFVVTIFAPTT